MKKVYLIKCINKKEDNPMPIVVEVFTNKKLAKAYVKYWNNEENHPYIYCIDEMKICKADYRFTTF